MNEFELDVAARLVEKHGERLRYVTGIGWFVWSETHWQRDERERAREAVKRIIADMRTEAAELRDDGLWKLCRRVATARGVKAILDLAASDKQIRLTVDELDTHAHLLACKNGIVDLRDGAIKKPDPAELISRCCPVIYDPNAEAPMFEKFLGEVQPKQDVRDYLARLFGYAATGIVREHVLAVLWGPGANGKSVLADVVTHVLGDHAKPGPVSLIVTDGRHAPHPTDVASCAGSRLVIVHETKRGAGFDSSKVKLLTGGDRLTARFMRQDFFDFRPTHTLVMLSNYKPVADANDAALWRRVQLVPFEVVIPIEEQDRELAEKIKAAEAAGVLHWIVEGAAQWYQRGLQPPDIVLEQTEAYRAAEDVIGRFIEDRCVKSRAAKVKAGALYEVFRSWCKEQGERAVRGNEFFNEMVGRGYERQITNQGRVYRGIGLHASEYDDGGRDG